MSPILFQFLPVFGFGLFALALLFKIYKRSKSTFISISGFALIANLIFYGCFNSAVIIAIIAVTFQLVRAMPKDAIDVWFTLPCSNCENHKRRESDA